MRSPASTPRSSAEPRRIAARRAGALAGLLLLAVGAGCGLLRGGHPPLAVAEDVDLARYLGTWYEIARFEGIRFQEGCAGTTADYGPRDDGRIEVVNRCVRDGELDEIRGIARRADEEGAAAKLEVSFFRPFWGDYWILAVDEERFSLVGTPSRGYLWILAREPALDPDLYARLVGIAADRGFDVSRLRPTPQPPTLGPHAP